MIIIGVLQLPTESVVETHGRATGAIRAIRI